MTTRNIDAGDDATPKVTIIDADIDGMTGLNEPVKLAHIQVRTGGDVTNVLAIRNYHRRDGFGFGEGREPEVWVSEYWALEADEKWNPKKFPGGAGSDHNELFHWSTKGFVEWDEVVEAVEDNLYLLSGQKR